MSKKAFISHTSLLKDWPKPYSFLNAAIDGVVDAGWTYKVMSQFPSSSMSSLEESCLQIRESDLYVGILGFDWGSTPLEDPLTSFVKKEFNFAITENKETLLFIISSDCPFPMRVLDGIPQGDKDNQNQFRNEVQTRLHAPSISTPEHLRSSICNSIKKFEERTVLKPYLNWVIEKCQHVDFSLADQNPHLPPQRWKMEERYVKLQVHVSKDDVYEPYGRQDVLEALQKNPLVALLGEPGGGKTTALRYAALSYARASIESNEPIPILLQARTIAQYFDNMDSNTEPAVEDLYKLWDAEVLRHDWKIPSTWLPIMMAKGVVMMIDELDGVPKDSIRQVLHLIQDCTARFPQSRWVVVSRPFAWRHSILPAFRIATMCDLSDDTVKEYINSWGSNSSASDFTKALMEKMQKIPTLFEIAHRPLFLMAICIIYNSQKLPLPSDHLDLLKLITKWLISSRPPLFTSFTTDERMEYYEVTGFAMCDLTVTSRGDIDALSSYFPLGTKELNLQKMQDFLNDESPVTGLLRQEGGSWRFSHRIFQDLFAALHLYKPKLSDEGSSCRFSR